MDSSLGVVFCDNCSQEFPLEGVESLDYGSTIEGYDEAKFKCPNCGHISWSIITVGR